MIPTILCDLFIAIAYEICEPNDTTIDAIQPCRKAQTLIMSCTRLNSINCGDYIFEALLFCLHHSWNHVSTLVND
jgi:hypothetical protein